MNPSWRNLTDIVIDDFENWTVAKLHVASVDAVAHIAYLTGTTTQRATFGFTLGHRYLVENVPDALNQPGSARAAIREALMGYARRAAAAQGQQGCLITAAAMEMMPDDAEVSALISRMFRRMQDLFAGAVIRGQASGEIAGDLDERAIARMLLCTIQGLRVLGKTGPSEQEMTEVVETALRALA